MVMTYQNQVYGPIQHVAFDPDKKGFVSAAQVTKNESIYESTSDCSVATLDVYENVQEILKDTVVGYGLTVGTSSNAASGFTSGYARTSSDGPEKQWVLGT